ncbi:MAG TPA: hypothetical protein VLW06_15885 [Terriglobales bacterium]|nr:hypothetical protein [Terriglobales bacterium]
MKTRTAIRLFEYLCLLLLASVAGAQQLQIVSAEYGSGPARIDVTRRVRELSRQSAAFQVNNDVFGIDPAPGRVKTLRVRATDSQGRVRTFEYREGSMVNTAMFAGWNGGPPPMAQSGYVILRALYGVPGRNVDVTQRLRQLAAANARFRMGNSTFGVDPAPGQRKMLRIWARGPNGDVRKFDYPESSTVDGAMFSSWGSGRWGDPNWNGGWEGPGRR